MSTVLEELLQRIEQLPPERRAQLTEQALEHTSALTWVPNPGPQTQALETEADELFFGGEAGGGKSDLVIGLAFNYHRRSLLLRRYNEDARALAERAAEVQGSSSGFSFGTPPKYRDAEHSVDFGGCKEESDKQRYKGRPHDLIGFDEIGDFLESQYRFIIGWNRTVHAGQRVRVVCTGNPPTTAEGLWVIQHWGPWLDPTHPRPAEPGELRWFTSSVEGDIEVDGPGPHLIDGEWVGAKSRTFIRSRLDDNPDLTRTDDYRRALAALPAELRVAYRDGNFAAGMKDDPWQVIPTQWIVEAQERWTKRPARGVPMCGLGADVAQGGDDNNVISTRYDGWFDELQIVPGSETGLGKSVAAHILVARKDNAPVCLDCGGGYGGLPYATLTEAGVEVRAYKGAEASHQRTADGKLKFVNKRAEVFWRLREALDPEQPFGSPLALPPDRQLLADLSAFTYEVGPQGIKLVDPAALAKKLGRSPDRAYAVVLCWAVGARGVSHRFAPGGSSAEQGLRKYPTMQRTAVMKKPRRR